MRLNKRILAIILLIVLFILLIKYQKDIESFVVCDSRNFENEDIKKSGFFSVVDTDDNNEDSYDLEYEGPKCLATCIMEHGVNPNFKNPYGTNDIFQWHRDTENIGKGYCFNANDKEYPFKCDGGNCIDKCTSENKNKIANQYYPEDDFSRCKKDEDFGCIEDGRLNFLTGISAQTTTGCKECVNKYFKNLDSMMQILRNEINTPACPA